jgi:hypothetical protein
MMKMIVEANPDLETTNKPKQRWRQLIHEFVTGSNFKHKSKQVGQSPSRIKKSLDSL